MIDKVLSQVDENKVVKSRSSSVRAVASQGSYLGKNSAIFLIYLYIAKKDEEKAIPVAAPVAISPMYVQGGNTIDIESR